jgi:hypothetical protein
LVKQENVFLTGEDQDVVIQIANLEQEVQQENVLVMEEVPDVLIVKIG